MPPARISKKFVMSGHRLLLAVAALSLASAATEAQSSAASDVAADLALQPTAPFDYHSSMPVITKRELAAAFKHAETAVQKWRQQQQQQQQQQQRAKFEATTNWLLANVALGPTPQAAINQTNAALLSEASTRLLASQFGLNRLQVARGLPLISVESSLPAAIKAHCKQQPLSASRRPAACAPGKYRSLSGHCNNVQQADWGAAHTAYARFAPAAYVDAVGVPRGESNGLPSPALVSQALRDFSANDTQPSSHLTTMTTFFGQFVAHDLALTTSISVKSGRDSNGRHSTNCCRSAGEQSESSLLSECLPVVADTPDGSSQCTSYVRSTPAVKAGCSLGPREQLNSASAYLDGSTIYGTSEEQLRRLRLFAGGRLRVSRMGGADLLPLISEANSSASDGGLESHSDDVAELAERCRLMAQMRSQPPLCFEAGDLRANENLGLTLMHTAWLREHNYIATKLAALNKHWSDERLFEEARRLVAAELQHIAYNEFLPTLLGADIMQRFNLSSQLQGYSQNYEPQISVAMSNEVATAILLPYLRMSMPSALEQYSERLEMLGTVPLADTFLDGSALMPPAGKKSVVGSATKVGQFLMGLMSQSAMEPSASMHSMSLAGSAATSSTQKQPIKMLVDQTSLALQQGRDHGLRSYLYWRHACQLRPSIKSWTELRQAALMPDTLVRRLKQVYASVDDIELLVGALFEAPLPGATLGPTAVCLLARQFYNTKHGDRYWHENDLPDSGFSAEQLDQIRQTSLAKVLCRNFGFSSQELAGATASGRPQAHSHQQASISFVQPQPMLTSDTFLNSYQYCTNRAMTTLDLAAWRELLTSVDEVSVGGSANLARGRRLIEINSKLVAESLQRAERHALESVAKEERQRKKRTTNGDKQAAAAAAAGYRYLGRPKRQTLALNNASLILELATSDVVRALIRHGRDREQLGVATSTQTTSDVRDFLASLEALQLNNLLENFASTSSLQRFIATAGSGFLSGEQRQRLNFAVDPSLVDSSLQPPAGDSLEASLAAGSPSLPLATSRSSSVAFENCQDDDTALPCDHTTPYRTITGMCNNLRRVKFGASFTPLERLLPSAYDDGLSAPRLASVAAAAATSGKTASSILPSPRLISTTMHGSTSKLHARYSLALMQFGQFGVDHDLTRTPFSVSLDGSLLDCSACDSQQTVHRDCLPISVPINDKHFSTKKCLHFVRSLNGQSGLGPRQQLNALTAYIDGSNIYGSDNCEAKSLRLFAGGRLNSSTISNNLAGSAKELLPVTRANPECATPSGVCFHAGDQRASEQPGLTSIHTIFMRFHNSIVDKLATINKHWNDERLYQTGRRIVGATMQRLTFNEFAPRLLGLDYMSKFDLLLKDVGYNNVYDDSCSAGILNEFSAAAFRMGHSLLRSAFPLLDKQYRQIGEAFQLRKAFFNSQRILKEPFLMDAILRGVVTTPIETLDNTITEEVTNHLFEKPSEPFSGMDLVSLNIQRAREHGIGGYNSYRAKCNLTHAKSFDDLRDTMPQHLIAKLSSLYAHVDDIDLFTGGLSELPVHGGIIGPTLGCIIGMQFSRLKKCDRFWHETSDSYVRFSQPQLAEIRKLTLAKIICEQSDSIDAIQRNAMDVSDVYLNPRVPCSSLPGLNLEVWRENVKSCALSNKKKLELGHSKRISPCKSCTCTSEGLELVVTNS